jgi:Tfp pilus assembly protein PilF
VQCNQARKLNAASAQKREQDAAKASAAGSKAVTGADGEECAMCLDALSSSGECVQLPCGHVYHQSCVKGLRKYGVNDLCPVCRARLPAGPMAKMDGGVRLAVAAGATKDAQLQRRRYADAAVLLRQALAEDSSLAKAHHVLGCALRIGEADIDGAEAAWRAAITCDGQHADTHCALGQLLLLDRDAFAEAEALFRRTIELEPRHVPAHASLGWALTEQGGHEGAEAAFRCALAIDPTDPHAQAGLRTTATRKAAEDEAKEAAAQQAMMELLLEEEEDEKEGGGKGTGGGGGGGSGKKRGGGGKKDKKKRNN